MRLLEILPPLAEAEENLVMTRNRETRFLNKVKLGERAPIGGRCWEWHGAVGRKGYGRFWDGRRLVPAYRWAYEHFRGPVPDGLEMDHLCRNSACANPHHVEPVTHAENVRRHIDTLTHCVRGHPRTEEFGRWTRASDGYRRWKCMPCMREHRRAWKARQ